MWEEEDGQTATLSRSWEWCYTLVVVHSSLKSKQRKKKQNILLTVKNKRQLCREKWAFKKKNKNNKKHWRCWENLSCEWGISLHNLTFSYKCMFLCSPSLTVQQNRASNYPFREKVFIFVVVNTQCQAGLPQEKSSTAQQVMRFMLPAAATALCLETNTERIGHLQWEAIANTANQAKKLNKKKKKKKSHFRRQNFPEYGLNDKWSWQVQWKKTHYSLSD